MKSGETGRKCQTRNTSTALFFFRDEKFHDVLATRQIEARMMVLELMKAGKVNPLIAQSFENSLYDRFAPHRAEEFRDCALLRWPELKPLMLEVLDEFAVDIDFDELLHDVTVTELVSAHFSEAAIKTRTTAVPVYLDQVSESLTNIMLETSDRFGQDEGWEEAVRGMASVTLGVCLGTAPAIEMASGISAVHTATSILTRLDAAPWGENENGDYWWGASELIKRVLERLRSLTEANAMHVDPDMAAMQAELQKIFAGEGVDFMTLHPVVHRAILIEALQMGGAEAALASFLQILKAARRTQKEGFDPVDFLIEAHEVKLAIYEGHG